MQMLDNVIIILLIIGAFTAGMKLSNWFHFNAQEHEKYMLQKQFLRFQANCDADDPCQPYVAPPVKRRYNVSPEFVERLRHNGAATERVHQNQAI